MSEEQTNFKVTDRRLFNADGSPRELSAEETVQIKTEATPLTSEATESSVAPAETQDAATDQSAVSQSQSRSDIPDEAEIPGVDDPASFANFMMSIASNAASSLGMMEHPVTHKRDVDLELGKHWIDVLGMLQDKTRGNLSPQEAQILEGLLADLRMQYVSLANATTQKAPRAFSSSDITGGR
ncbi:MAG: DUF1844 domain-containing protein [bacterium]